VIRYDGNPLSPIVMLTHEEGGGSNSGTGSDDGRKGIAGSRGARLVPRTLPGNVPGSNKRGSSRSREISAVLPLSAGAAQLAGFTSIFAKTTQWRTFLRPVPGAEAIVIVVGILVLEGAHGN